MNKRLEFLFERAAAWPEEAQEEAVRALTDIERKHVSRDEDLAQVREQVEGSLSDERPDVPLDDAFERIERLHAERRKASGDAS
jgi:hypothetical protein